GVLGADDDVGLVEEVHCAARGHTVHGRDHRLPDALLLGTEFRARILLAPDVDAGPPRSVPHVQARAERPVTGGAQHHRADLVVLANSPPQLADLLGHALIERVEPPGTVQGHRGHMAVQLDLDRGFAGLVHVVPPRTPGLSPWQGSSFRWSRTSRRYR